MATTAVSLTTSFQLIATASGFIAQRDFDSVIEICNAASTPTEGDACHTISRGDSLQFPTPASGNWYARIRTTDASAKLIVTLV